MISPITLFTVLPTLASVILPAAGLPLPNVHDRSAVRRWADAHAPQRVEKRQIGVSVLGFTTLVGEATNSFAAEVASETGAAPSPTSTGATPTSTGTSSSSGGSSGKSASDILSLLEDLGTALSQDNSKAGAGSLSSGGAKAILGDVEDNLSSTTSNIKGLTKPTDGSGNLNVTAVADDAIFVLQQALSVTNALESNPLTDVIIAPELATVDTALTALLVACQLFVDVEPAMKAIIEGNASLKSELEKLGGSVLKVLGL